MTITPWDYENLRTLLITGVVGEQDSSSLALLFDGIIGLPDLSIDYM